MIEEAPPAEAPRIFSRIRGIPATVALAIAGVFLPVVIVPYAFSDDYTFLWMAVSHEPTHQFGTNLFEKSAVQGRPLSGVLHEIAFTAAGAIDNLRFVRLVSLLAIVALAVLLHRELVRGRIGSAPAGLLAVLVCTLPAFQVYAAWASLFVAPCAALLGALGSLLCVSAADAPRGFVLDRLIGATVALVAAMLIYQPAAMFFWVFFATALVAARTERDRSPRLTRIHLGVAGVAFALAYAGSKISTQLGSTRVHRTTLTHDPVEKLRWFFHEPLYRSLNLFDLTPSRWLAAVVAVIAVVGIGTWLTLKSPRPLLYAALAVALVPLSYLPNLVAAESWAAYRTQAGLSALIALYLGFGLLGLWSVIVERARSKRGSRALMTTGFFLVGAATLGVGASAFIAAGNVTNLFVDPQMTELRMLRSQAAAFPTSPAQYAFVQTSRTGGMTTQLEYDEFGLPSFAVAWTPKPGLSLVLREEGRLKPLADRPPIQIYWPATTTFPADAAVVDLRGLRKLR